MKFKYKKYGSIFRPAIEITLRGESGSVRYEALVDSGADICLFDEEVGKYIGIDVTSRKKEEVFGVGGKCSVYYVHPITIEVGGWSYKINAGFMPDVAGRVMPYGLVGQNGFFNLFTVKFDNQKQEIELRAYDKK